MRWLPLTGLGFVVCFVAAVGLYGSGAGSDASGIVAYYASDANRLRQIGGFAVLLLGCLLLLVYAWVVARTVVAAELSGLVLASGAGSALLLAVGDAFWAATAFAARCRRGRGPRRRVPVLAAVRVPALGRVGEPVVRPGAPTR